MKMRAKITAETDKQIEDAKAFIRSALAGQQLDEDTLNSVAIKIVRALPRKSGATRKAA
jgi:hypothetical protein